MSASNTGQQLQPFFSYSHWARLSLMALLAVAFAATTVQAAWQLLQSSTPITGQFVEVAEAKTGVQTASYTLVLRVEGGELEFVRLRNNGRVHNYLLSRGAEISGPLSAVVRQGSVTEITLGGDNPRTVRDARIPPAIQLIIGLFPLLLLVLHIRPELVVRKES